jgi:hypothetical protein
MRHSLRLRSSSPCIFALLLLSACGIDGGSSVVTCHQTVDAVDALAWESPKSVADAKADCESNLCSRYSLTQVCRCDCGPDRTASLVGTWTGTETLTITDTVSGQQSSSSAELILGVERSGWNGVRFRGFCRLLGAAQTDREGVPANIVADGVLQWAGFGPCERLLDGCNTTYDVGSFSAQLTNGILSGTISGSASGPPPCPAGPEYSLAFQVHRSRITRS